MVPGLDIRPADPDGEAADLDRLARHAARHWTPLAMPVAGEGLWLDIGASAHLFGGEAAFARRVLALCGRLGLTARMAVADTAAAAHALARCADRPLTICPPGGEAEALASLPLEALRIDPALAALARRLGIDTAGALLAMPRGPLVRRFGKDLLTALDQASGARAAPLDPVLPTELPSSLSRFVEPILTAESIRHALEPLVGSLCAGLLERGIGARTVALTLTRVDAAEQRIAIGLARPSRDAAHILRLLASRIEAIEPGFGIERMQLTAERFDPLEPQHVSSGLTGRDEAEDIALLVDRLATRLGWRRLYRAAAVESDVPERSLQRIEPLAGPGAERTAGWAPWPRPTRLLDPPEPVQDVMALLPDGIPRRFRWRGDTYVVVRGDGPERIHGEWWRRPAERDATRDYFQVEDQSGARFWLFRRGDGVDGRSGDMSWHVHGLFG
jgi:protein ImuB